MQILKIVIIIADNNDLIDILIMDILCPNRITNQYSILDFRILPPPVTKTPRWWILSLLKYQNQEVEYPNNFQNNA